MIINTNNNTYIQQSIKENNSSKNIIKEDITCKTLPLLCKSDDLFLYDTNFYRKEYSSRL